MIPAEPQEPSPGRLSARQRRALGIVLSAPTLTEGCRLASIGRSTWWAWKRQPAFQLAVQAAEDQALAEGLARLKGGFLKAVEVLAELTASKNDGVRLQAVTVFLNQAVKAADSLDLRERIKALEARLAAGSER
jgi:hypothetical protein